MSKTILLNQNWIFSKDGHDETVTLPHTWNAMDGQDGGNDYYRGTCSYTTVLPDISLPENGRAVLQFDAVAMTAEATVEELIGSIHPHPTVNEALGEAFMAAWNGKAINSL